MRSIQYPEVGELVTSYEVLTTAPRGTQVRENNTTWTRGERFYEGGGGSLAPRDFTLSGLTVVAYPEGFTIPEYVPPTVEAFKQEAATVVMGAGQRSRVDLDPIIMALGTLGIAPMPDTLRPGMMLDYSDARWRRTVLTARDHRAVVQMGHPDVYSVFGVASIDYGGNVANLLGRAIYGGTHLAGFVTHAPDSRPWQPGMDRGTAEDEEAIRLLRSQMWDVGVKAKRANQWCREYEAAMGRLGVTEASLIREPGTVGSTVTPEQAFALPEGTILNAPRHSDGQTVFYRRDNTRTSNASHTRRWLGPAGNGHYNRGGMTVVAQPGGIVPMTDNNWLTWLPLGSVIFATGGGSQAYEKIADHVFRQMRPDPDRAGAWLSREGGGEHAHTAFRSNYGVIRLGPTGEWLS